MFSGWAVLASKARKSLWVDFLAQALMPEASASVFASFRCPPSAYLRPAVLKVLRKVGMQRVASSHTVMVAALTHASVTQDVDLACTLW